MKKSALIAIIASTFFSISAVAMDVQCPTAAQVNAGLKDSDGDYYYDVTDATGVEWHTFGIIVNKPAQDAIQSMQFATVYPESMYYSKGDMACTYSSSTGNVTLYTQTPVKAKTTVPNHWVQPQANGVASCISSDPATCLAVKK